MNGRETLELSRNSRRHFRLRISKIGDALLCFGLDGLFFGSFRRNLGVLAFLIIGLGSIVPISAEPWPLGSPAELKKAVLPVYLKSESRPLAVFRADRIYHDHQRRGFFRIGGLPLLVLQGLSLQLSDTNRLQETLHAASGHFHVTTGPKHAIEARNFSIVTTSQNKALVRAQLVHMDTDDVWLLQDGIIATNQGTETGFRRATLKLAGPQTGELVLETSQGPIRANLISLFSDKQ